MVTITDILLLVLWAFLWLAGGILIIHSLFNIKNEEKLLLGAAAGLVLENWLANIISRLVEVQVGFWLAPVFIFVIGVFLAYKSGEYKNLSLRKIFFSVEAFWLLTLVIFFTLIGRGLPIFDDFQNLPTISRMAAGDVPPHFALNPELNFGYHYFLLLVSAQVARIGGVFPAVALDLARSFFLVVTVMLGGKFVYRLTASRVAEGLGVLFLLFSSGARWLFFLFPVEYQSGFNAQVQLIGSGADTGTNLYDALIKPWMIEAGPIAFPFAFASGINPPLIMALGGVGASAAAIVLMILMTFNARKGRPAFLSTGIFFASLALADEVWFFLLGGGMLLSAITIIWKKDTGFSREGTWLAICAVGGGITALLQGGMLTELFRGLVGRIAQTGTGTYFDTTMHLIFPPALVSGHLGILHLNNPYQLIAGLIEIGSMSLAVLLLPIAVISFYRKGDALLLALGLSGLVSGLMVFVLYKGSGGVSGTTRLYEAFIFTGMLFSFPILWKFLQTKGVLLKSIGAAFYGIAILSGVVIFAISLAGISKPVLGDFIRTEDMPFFTKYWNKLPENALIFDVIPERAVTIFGRATKSSLSWFEDTPEWEALKLDPSPQRLKQAGYDYAYLDLQDWEGLTAETQAKYKGGCAKLVEKLLVEDRGRRLYDISGCQ